MFLGQYEHSIDEKGRMTIPARFRELLENGAYITRGFEHNLVVWPAALFEQVFTRVNQISMTDPAGRDFKRLIFSRADRVEIDRAGRILIPQFLREAASLDTTAVVVGVGNNFEIWTPTLWAEQDARLQDPQANATHFANLDLSLQ
jgi:MraZ protein